MTKLIDYAHADKRKKDKFVKIQKYQTVYRDDKTIFFSEAYCTKTTHEKVIRQAKEMLLVFLIFFQ